MAACPGALVDAIGQVHMPPSACFLPCLFSAMPHCMQMMAACSRALVDATAFVEERKPHMTTALEGATTNMFATLAVSFQRL